MAMKQKYSKWHIAARVLEILEAKDRDDFWEELNEYEYWWQADRFDRRAVNRRLKEYATGADAWWL